ncbi:PepSY domain-containing protein [Massilia norwichensis]|jgi:uncharacterized membrane protein YkoI|uniref:PepSY domain-containing protein n=1 Tax=Massilia norwichensis TaxID=1442366 RepID=A0ABT2A247_9BURK|nr:PepSY domain-containing protein [Massilia norwichensis]MCS0588266.1 PepSY domain-containing protein [Massilia norwichensis]
MFRTKTLVVVAAFASTAGTLAFAAQKKENDALGVMNAKVSLVEAVSLAQQHANGRAARAEYEHSKRGWLYDVEVVSGHKVFDVRIDAVNGAVISSVEDKLDGNDENDKED